MPTPQEIARDVTIRSRAGDQNAMALIAETRRSADQGSEVAKRQLAAIFQYCKQNPASNRERPFRDWSDVPPMTFQGEDKACLGQLKTASSGVIPAHYRPQLVVRFLAVLCRRKSFNLLNVCALILSRGKKLIPEEVQRILAEVSPRYHREFKAAVRGVPLPGNPPKAATDVYFIGRVINQAKAIQATALNPSVANIAQLCPRAAAEFS